MSEPLISVVMPVYNAGRYLVEAVASVIEQTCTDWELICVNDGSRDQSPQILDWFAQQDGRISVIHQANAGIVQALNRGGDAARAPLLCRMDADDIALPQRLARQLEYMRSSPNCVAVGGAIIEIDTDGDPLTKSSLSVEHDDILNNLLTRKTGLFHPTVLMRTEAFRAVGGYRAKYQWIEDHDLWLRMAQRGQLSNLPEVVLAYRQHSLSVCWQRSGQQRELMNALLREAYLARGQNVPERLIFTEDVVRTAANPGKWARAAAKGGYPSSVRKHLAQLLSKTGPLDPYFLRMTIECSLRNILGIWRRFWLEKQVHVPKFTHWQRRIGDACVEGSSSQQLNAA